ncbi:MAG: isopenicillin N synthase family oxygenase [Brevundimonas sp.]|nr:MAG: isopenicillin N synthase family oxygenase [Brevundimonas sp.]
MDPQATDRRTLFVTDTLAPASTTGRAIQPVSMTLHDQDFQAFSDSLGQSFERYGFAVVTDHGLDADLIGAAIADAKAFFALPEDVKRRYHQPGTGGARGLTPFGVEAAKDAATVDLKEFWHVGRELPESHTYRRFMRDNVWPTEIEGFRRHVYGMFDAMDLLGRRILSAIARHLGLADDWFDDKVQLGNSVLRLLHYPPVPADAPGVRAGAHEDINVITLLLGAEEAGLQLLERSGEWLDVAPPPGALVVNIGDMLQRLTNHVLPSTTHRVVNPPPERRGFARYSTPFFLHFNPDFLIETLPSTIDADQPDRYAGQAITAEDFLLQRLREIRLL